MRKSVVACLLLTVSLIALLGACSSKPDPEVELGGISLVEVLDGVMQRTSRVFGGLRGIESAKAARVKLEEIVTDYDDLLFHAPKLSLSGRSKLSQAAARYLPELQRTTGMVNDSPALQPILGPVMQTIMERHQALMSTSMSSTDHP